jgi:hypothetical protein
VDALNQKIEQITGNFKLPVFETIKSVKGDEDINVEKRLKELFNQEFAKIDTAWDGEMKLIDLPEDVLGKILKPMNKETRQLIYVQRNIYTLNQAHRVYDFWVNQCLVAYHVSDRDIKDKLVPKEGEDSVFFSTDIKRLFNLKSAKYIYAFRINEQVAKSSRYCAVDCFGQIKIDRRDGIEIEDSIPIFSPGDPSYRQQQLEDLGASFDQTYHSPKDSADQWLRRRSQGDESSAYELRT